jgi:hypothetical protein
MMPRHLELPRTWILVLAFALGGALACDDDDDEIGKPCETHDDCSAPLICDVHDGQGTCQHEHGHRVNDPAPGRVLVE